MTQILGVKFSDHGPVCYFASGALVVRAGQAVLVETDQGLALGRVATVAAPEQEAAHAVPLLAGAAVQDAEPGPAPFDAGFGGVDWAEPAGEGPEARTEAGPESGQEESREAAQGQTTVLTGEQMTQPQPKPSSTRGLQSIYRLAAEADLAADAENRRLARRAFSFCRGSIGSMNLDMKLVDVEVLHDRSKLIFFFTAPGRIDFRELIKSLVREFHTRIELRQIGVRHETQMIGAIGNCGQVCCCRRFLRKFAPVTIKMAKEQNLFLNPAKISGICGRLLCCLSYEQKGYEEFHKQCPKIGKRLQTPVGSVKVLRANFFKKSISVWVEDAGEREYTLEEWKEMLSRQPGDTPPPEPAAAQGRSASGRQGRPSSGRPARPEKSERQGERQGERSTERLTDRSTERQADRAAEKPQGRPAEAAPVRQADAEAQAAPDAEAQGGDAGRERSRPRRKRRKGKGPRPAQ